MPLTCDAARRMLADALKSRMAVPSLAQVLVSLYEILGKSVMLTLLDEFNADELAPALRIAQAIYDSESSWEIPIHQPKPRIPGGLAGKVKRNG